MEAGLTDEASVGELSGRFRFKRKSSTVLTDQAKTEHSHRPHDRRQHPSHHRSKRRRTSNHAPDLSSAYDNSTSSLPPDVAFRESLFDALGDDEGAAFWQGVYGQPIHTYPDAYENEETGELERMNDEEYAQYVRRKMWEKSHEGIEAARQEKRRQKEAKKRETEQKQRTRSRPSRAQDEPEPFEFKIEASLRRGEERKERRRWKALWDDYLQRWQDLQDIARDRKGSEVDSETLYLRNKIAWPVETGNRKDISAEAVQEFITRGASLLGNEASEQDEVLKALKMERIRWHPDKIQHRYGFMQIDERTLKDVTATFQILDGMWNKMKERS